LKLENILIGKDDPNVIYLIDFGLASRWRHKGGVHVAKTRGSFFFGNVMFASLNAFNGITRSRRDDIQSAFYIMLYLLNRCNLPW